MLTKKDKEAIRQIFREEIALSHTRTLTIEYGPRKQGDPADKVVKDVQVNMLDFWTEYAPKIEAALRGMQEDVDRTVNRVNEQGDKVDAIGATLLNMEHSAKIMAAISDQLPAILKAMPAAIDITPRLEQVPK